MRILYVTSSLDAAIGGPAANAVRLCKALARQGAQVTLATTVRSGPPPEAESLQAAGVRVVWAPRLAFGQRYAFSPGFHRLIQGLAAETDVAVLDSIYLYTNLAAARALRTAGKPYVIRPAGTFDEVTMGRRPWRKTLAAHLGVRGMIRRASAFFFTAEPEQAFAQRHIAGRPSFVLRLGFDMAEAAGAEPEAFLAVHPELRCKPVILFLSRLNFKKGLDVLIPAFADLLAVRPDARLVLAGPDDGYQAACQALVRAHGLGERVVFAGLLTGAMKWSAFAAARLFVLPSHSENFGHALVEALAVGIPAIVTPGVMISPAIEEAGAGLRIPLDQTALTQAMLTLITDDDAHAISSRKARALVREAFSADGTAARLIEALQSVIDKSNPSIPAAP